MPLQPICMQACGRETETIWSLCPFSLRFLTHLTQFGIRPLIYNCSLFLKKLLCVYYYFLGKKKKELGCSEQIVQILVYSKKKLLNIILTFMFPRINERPRDIRAKDSVRIDFQVSALCDMTNFFIIMQSSITAATDW